MAREYIAPDFAPPEAAWRIAPGDAVEGRVACIFTASSLPGAPGTADTLVRVRVRETDKARLAPPVAATSPPDRLGNFLQLLGLVGFRRLW
jgi:hypothetical protein